MTLFRTNSAQETARVGYRLGKILKKGDVVCLTGDLGTGKTAFTKGIADALNVKNHVTSPTFTIINEYENADMPIYHFDVYRISSPEELLDIGFEDYMDKRGIVVIEWAELVESILPGEYIKVDIKTDPSGGSDARQISIEFIGSRYKEYNSKLAGLRGEENEDTGC